MKTIIKYGFIISFLSFIWICLEYWVGLHTRYIDYHPYLTNFAILIPIIFLYLGMKEKRKLKGGSIFYWDAVLTGSFISLATGIFNLLSQTAYHKLVNPGFFEDMIQYSLEKGYHKDTASATAYFNFNTYLLAASLGVVVAGFVLSLLIASFLKKNTPSLAV